MAIRRAERAVVAAALRRPPRRDCGAGRGSAPRSRPRPLRSPPRSSRPTRYRGTVSPPAARPSSCARPRRSLYLYTSTDTAYGVFRLAFPHPLRQSSRFRIAAGEVEPLAFQAGGAGNEVMAQFDWKSGQVTGMAKGKLLDSEAAAGDSGPAVGADRDHAQAAGAGRPRQLSGCSIATRSTASSTSATRQSTLDTPLGKLRTVLYTSHQTGSNKTTYLWLAPRSTTCRRAPSSASRAARRSRWRLQPSGRDEPDSTAALRWRRAQAGAG